MRDDTNDQWTPERCTRQLPTDAYGEIDFLGHGTQTKNAPVSMVYYKKIDNINNNNNNNLIIINI